MKWSRKGERAFHDKVKRPLACMWLSSIEFGDYAKRLKYVMHIT